MLDHEAAALAMRTRLRAVSVATTGSTTLVRTTTGYTRAAGSFITDGFRVGMELLETGFPTNGYYVVKEVAAQTLTVDGTLTAATSASGRTLAVGLPETRVWENQKAMRSGAQIETPTAGRPYVSDEWVPATHEQETFPAQSAQATETGLYIVTLYGLSNTGTAGIRAYTEAISALFTPGTTVTVGSDTVRMQRLGARTSQITPLANGWTYQQVTIPWFVRTANVVAA